MPQALFRVVVAGGGVAGLETLLALRALAGDSIDLALVAPDDEFVYRPLSIHEPFAVGRTRRVPLRDAASAAGAAHFSTTITAVDASRRTIDAIDGSQLEYEALVLAVGAEPMPAVAHVLTWDDRADAELLGGLLRDVEQGYTHRVAVVIPPGPGWPLRGYELALLVALDAKASNVAVQTTVITAEHAPLDLLGPRSAELVAAELERAGIAVVATADVEVVQGSPVTAILHPSGRRLVVDRALALPVLRGRRISGIPADADGFLDIDEHCRLRGMAGIWAAGDVTNLPLKSGAVAAEQGDVAAADIAAAAGAVVERHTLDLTGRDGLAGLPAGRHLEGWLGAGEDAVTTHLPPVGVPVLTYLQRDLAAGWRGSR